MGGDMQAVQHVICPAPLPRVEALSGGGVRVLGHFLSRQPVVEKVGHQQQRAGGVQLRVRVLHHAE